MRDKLLSGAPACGEVVAVSVHPECERRTRYDTGLRDTLLTKGATHMAESSLALSPCWLSVTLSGRTHWDQSTLQLPGGQALANFSRKEKPAPGEEWAKCMCWSHQSLIRNWTRKRGPRETGR